MITAAQLQHVMPATQHATEFADPLNATMHEFGIDAIPLRMAMFLAQVAVESQELNRERENLNYDAAGLLRTFHDHFKNGEESSYAHHPEAIANRVYANRYGNGDEWSGDGWGFRGGGLFGLTFRDNYAAAGDALGLDLRSYPQLIEQPINACRTAGWYWHTRKCNDVADANDFAGVSALVNTGNRSTPASRINGYANRLAFFTKAKEVLGL